MIQDWLVKATLDLANEIGIQKKGALFIISEKNLRKNYDLMYPQIRINRRITDKAIRPVIKKLAELDGAVVIDKKGKIVAYGAKVLKTKVFRGHGTRHSAARGVSELDGVIAITVSEEDGWVRIFEKGILVAELNSRTKVSPTLLDHLSKIIVRPELPILGSAGITATALSLANPLIAVLIFTGGYVITKMGAMTVKEFIKSCRK